MASQLYIISKGENPVILCGTILYKLAASCNILPHSSLDVTCSFLMLFFKVFMTLSAFPLLSSQECAGQCHQKELLDRHVRQKDRPIFDFVKRLKDRMLGRWSISNSKQWTVYVSQADATNALRSQLELSRGLHHIVKQRDSRKYIAQLEAVFSLLPAPYHHLASS